jgi:hypothetical protein
MKTSELTGNALNWAVNYAEGLSGIFAPVDYCDRWSDGGPIIEREGISLDRVSDSLWVATRLEGVSVSEEDGPTPLVAAMRCYVASKLGDDIDVPEWAK